MQVENGGTMGLVGRRRRMGAQTTSEPLIVATREFLEQPVERVWEVVATTLGAVRPPDESLSYFPVPGTPADRVGSLWCCFSPGQNGLVGLVTEVVDRQEGSRVATRTWFADGEELRTIRLEGWPGGCRVHLATRIGHPSLDPRQSELAARKRHREYFSFLTSMAAATDNSALVQARPIHPRLDTEFEPSFTFSESIFIDRPASHVWEFAYDPASTRLVDDTCEYGFIVPGTAPRQVGEQQCFVYHRDEKRYATAGEVLELDWGHRAISTSFTGQWPTRSTTVVEAKDGGCVLSVESQGQAPADEQTRGEASIHAFIRQYLSRVKACMESGQGAS